MDIKMKLRMIKFLRSACDVLAAMTAVAAMLIGGSLYWPLIIAAIVLLLVGLTLTMVFYRCPSCGKPLPVRGKTPRNCSFCGMPL